MKQPSKDLAFSLALHAWNQGVLAADAARCVEQAVGVSGNCLQIGKQEFELDEIERIRVVGAGKAGRAMAKGLQRALGVDVQIEKRVSGWINVPGNPATRSPFLASGLPTIWPFVARPAGVNLPTQDCYGGTLLMEDIVARSGASDLCIALISGGGSALLCHPARGVRIQDIVRLTDWLSKAGASIRQLNTVRKQISQVKGGRLAARFRGKHLASLILSDVLGDSLKCVASGPTVADESNASQALGILKQFDPKLKKVPRRILDCLHRRIADSKRVLLPDNVSNHVIGNVQTAMDAAVELLRKSGFECLTEIQSDENESAEQAGYRLSGWIQHRLKSNQPLALISGGEPVVEVKNPKGAGGRNQHLVLAALIDLAKSNVKTEGDFVLLSGGTDGEDGNTSVAGAGFNWNAIQLCRNQNLKPGAFFKSFDSHRFFAERSAGSLLRISGEASSNVCDLRIVLVTPKGFENRQ